VHPGMTFPDWSVRLVIVTGSARAERI
jgi:hypothetical protein